MSSLPPASGRICSMDIWNVGVLPQRYTASQPRRKGYIFFWGPCCLYL